MEKNGFTLLDTHYYGGIKKYQWVTIPLAITGVVIKKDGTKALFERNKLLSGIAKACEKRPVSVGDIERAIKFYSGYLKAKEKDTWKSHNRSLR